MLQLHPNWINNIDSKRFDIYTFLKVFLYAVGDKND